MKTKILAWNVALFILFGSNCTKSPEGPKYLEMTFRIKGVVTDETDGSPVNNALVTFGILFGIKASTKTDAEGRYSIIFVHVREIGRGIKTDEQFLWLRVTATGYEEKVITDEDENRVRLTEEWQTIDIQLEPDSGGI